MGPKVNSWGQGEFCRHHSQTKTRVCVGGKQTKTHKNPCLQLCTQRQGLGGIARKQSLCGRRCVYVNVMCMCAYTAYVTQLSTEVCRPIRQSAACHWVSCPVETDRGREGETLGRAPRLLGKSARVRYHFGGVSLHTPHPRKTSPAPSESFYNTFN